MLEMRIFRESPSAYLVPTVTVRKRMHEFLIIPFGMVNSSATIVRAMKKLSAFLFTCLFVSFTASILLITITIIFANVSTQV